MPKRRKPDDRAATVPVVVHATYAPVLKAGIQATATHVQEMHQAIAGNTFDVLQKVPGLSVPARLVQGMHVAITTGVYAAVRHGTGAFMSIAADAERFFV